MIEQNAPITRTLYVVFQGLISLVKFPNYYRAILINMPEHRVAVGHWLTERNLPQGVSLVLTGVKSGNGSLDGSKNILVDTLELDQQILGQHRYADIFLPTPLKAYSFFTADAKDVLDLNTAKPSSTQYSTTHVFEYELENLPADVTLTSVDFLFQCQESVPLPSPSNQRVSVIHVVNDPETTVSDQHSQTEFNLGCQLLKTDLRANAAISFPPQEKSGPPAGILMQELVPLALREKHVLPLIGAIRQAANQGTISPPVGSVIGASKFCGTPHAVIVPVVHG